MQPWLCCGPAVGWVGHLPVWPLVSQFLLGELIYATGRYSLGARFHHREFGDELTDVAGPASWAETAGWVSWPVQL